VVRLLPGVNRAADRPRIVADLNLAPEARNRRPERSAELTIRSGTVRRSGEGKSTQKQASPRPLMSKPAIMSPPFPAATAFLAIRFDPPTRFPTDRSDRVWRST